MLAMVKSIERFHIYLYGLDFTVVTDCYVLIYAVNKAHLNLRIARWILHLQSYRFKVVHRAGVKMSHVDTLSRIIALVDMIPIEKQLEYRQLKDPYLKQIALSLEDPDNNNKENKFEIIDGLP